MVRKYQIRKRIASASIDLDFLKELEVYLLEQEQTLLEGATDSTREKKVLYDIEIYDKYGNEELQSFESYNRGTLPNGTKRIKLSVRECYHRSGITVSLSEDEMFSYIEVILTGARSKEKAIGVVKEVQDRVKEHRNLNSMFHSMLSLLFWTPLVFVIPLVGPDLSRSYIDAGTVIYGLITILIVLYYILKFFSPYTTFDTKRNRTISKAVDKSIKWLGGVFILGFIAKLINQWIGM